MRWIVLKHLHFGQMVKNLNQLPLGFPGEGSEVSAEEQEPVLSIIFALFYLSVRIVTSDHFPETQPLQSVYSRDANEDERLAEKALRERDERIRELDMVIMVTTKFNLTQLPD